MDNSYPLHRPHATHSGSSSRPTNESNARYPKRPQLRISPSAPAQLDHLAVPTLSSSRSTPHLPSTRRTSTATTTRPRPHSYATPPLPTLPEASNLPQRSYSSSFVRPRPPRVRAKTMIDLSAPSTFDPTPIPRHRRGKEEEEERIVVGVWSKITKQREPEPPKKAKVMAFDELEEKHRKRLSALQSIATEELELEAAKTRYAERQRQEAARMAAKEAKQRPGLFERLSKPFGKLFCLTGGHGNDDTMDEKRPAPTLLPPSNGGADGEERPPKLMTEEQRRARVNHRVSEWRYSSAPPSPRLHLAIEETAEEQKTKSETGAKKKESGGEGGTGEKLDWLKY